MEVNKVEQIKNKICDHMLSVELDKLPTYELITYIQAFKALEGGYPFPGWGFNTGLGCASSVTAYGTSGDTSEGE